MSDEGYLIGLILASLIPIFIELFFKKKKWKLAFYSAKIKNGLSKLIIIQIHSQTKSLQLYSQNFIT